MCIYVHTHACICTYIYIHMCIHILYTYIHTYICVCERYICVELHGERGREAEREGGHRQTERDIDRQKDRQNTYKEIVSVSPSLQVQLRS